MTYLFAMEPSSPPSIVRLDALVFISLVAICHALATRYAGAALPPGEERWVSKRGASGEDLSRLHAAICSRNAPDLKPFRPGNANRNSDLPVEIAVDVKR